MIQEDNSSDSFEIWTNNLTKVYRTEERRIIAVDGIDIRMEKGVHGLLGPNGAGKTSTINMLIGAISITKGEARIRGYKAGSMEAKRLIGFLPQDPAFYRALTGKEYISYIAQLKGLKKHEYQEKIDELLLKYGIKHAENRLVKYYSGGMKQRLALATALIGDPQILILDEPTSNLDPMGRDEFIKEIRSLSKKMSIFVSSHVLSEIEQMCDRITIIDFGNIVLTDSIESIKKMHSQENNRYVLDTNSNDTVIKVLDKRDFIDNIWIEDKTNYIKIIPKDEDLLQKSIPKIIGDLDVQLRKFFREELSLQEIFLDILNKRREA